MGFQSLLCQIVRLSFELAIAHSLTPTWFRGDATGLARLYTSVCKILHLTYIVNIDNPLQVDEHLNSYGVLCNPQFWRLLPPRPIPVTIGL